jgi:hypothetical protein
MAEAADVRREPQGAAPWAPNRTLGIVEAKGLRAAVALDAEGQSLTLAPGQVRPADQLEVVATNVDQGRTG